MPTVANVLRPSWRRGMADSDVLDGILLGMNKTLDIDQKTLRDAREACGASSDAETVRLGLEALIRQAAYERLRRLGGSEPDAIETPRRRSSPRVKNEFIR